MPTVHGSYGITGTLSPVVLAILMLACGGDADETESRTEEHQAGTDTVTVESRTESEESGPTLGTDGSAMKVWADAYAADLGVPEMPGFVDLWWPYGGDIDGDGDIDSVGSFGMSSGGNGVYNYLAVFLSEADTLRFDAVLEYGYIGSGSRFINEVTSVDNGKISATTTVWTDDDSRCCPSDSGTVVFGWEPGSLVVVE